MPSLFIFGSKCLLGRSMFTSGLTTQGSSSPTLADIISGNARLLDLAISIRVSSCLVL